jgi:hypothetical protein
MRISPGSSRSAGSSGSILSIGSSGSILSIGSAGSILSIGSAGSILSVGSAGSLASVFSIGSAASLGSVFSALSRWSVRGWRSTAHIGGAGPVRLSVPQGNPQVTPADGGSGADGAGYPGHLVDSFQQFIREVISHLSASLALPEERRDTAVTAESAWCSARAVRAEGSRRSAARARRWTTSRVSGNAMASSIQRRIRAKRNTHILSVPSSSCPSPACAGVCSAAARRYPPSRAVITGRVRLICRACSAALVITAGRTAARKRTRPRQDRP